MEESLFSKLDKYGKSDYYPLHMPGHKRNIQHFQNPFAIDITEIDGFDNLFHAEGVLLEAQQRAARLYGADETFYLVNGSSCGILAAVSAVVRRGDRILMARNCHKASYHAALLNGLRVSYLYPAVDMECGMNGSIRVSDVRQQLLKDKDAGIEGTRQQLPEDKDAGIEGTRQQLSEDKTASIQEIQKTQGIRAVLITSPTYDGVVSDVRAIADAVHEAGAVLIVDEAHGAHFAMDEYFPQSALQCGADIVINSVHKTMPSMTQTALLHVKGDRVDRNRLKKYLGIYQSSSPSYVLMAGIDSCIHLMEKKGPELFDKFTKRLEKLRMALGQMKILRLVEGNEPHLEAFAFDRSKILISTKWSSLNGPELGRILRERYHMEPEMEAEQYITAIMTVADTEEGFVRLEQALLEIDGELERELLEKGKPFGQGGQEIFPYHNEEVLTIAEAEEAEKRLVPLEDGEGLISGEFVYLYPPGIPLLVPGERIMAGFAERIRHYRAIGLSVQGMQDYDGEKILVSELEK